MSNLKNTNAKSDSKVSRRQFIRTSAAAAAFTIVPRHVLGGPGQTPPSEKINIAVIGTGGQGITNIKALLGEPDAHIAAICDVNEQSDYSAFYYGGTAGWKTALEVLEKERGAPVALRVVRRLEDALVTDPAQNRPLAPGRAADRLAEF